MLAVTLCAFIGAIIIIIIIIRGNELEKNAGGGLEADRTQPCITSNKAPKRESLPLIVRTVGDATGGSASIEYV